MGRCIKCGTVYCSCPSDGICDSCARQGYPTTIVGTAPAGTYTKTVTQPVQASPCTVTESEIATWKRRVECIVNGNAATRVGLSSAQVNTIHSYVLSAWNYRSSPCMFDQFIPEIKSFMQLLDVNGICAP